MAGRKHTRPDPDTVREERREAFAEADAGRKPTPEEEQAADRNQPDEDVAENYEDMTERGARHEGEGRLP